MSYTITFWQKLKADNNNPPGRLVSHWQVEEHEIAPFVAMFLRNGGTEIQIREGRVEGMDGSAQVPF